MRRYAVPAFVNASIASDSARGARAHQRSEPGRIQIGHPREIQDHRGSSLAAHRIEKWSHVLHGEWTTEAEHSPIQPLDFQRF